jgi:glutamate/tyrosine decarboxylase-like PLP-dependent enzyme
MHPSLADDLAHLPELLEATRRYAIRVLAGLDERAAALAPAAVVGAPLPERGDGLRAALDEFARRWEPGFSGSAGARYLGFVTGGATPASLAGDWLIGTFDQNPTAGIDSSAPDLERETVSWLRSLFGLSNAHAGAFVSGATMSNFVGLAIAREWLGDRSGISIAQAGMTALGPVEVLSGMPHSSIYKALSMLGIGRVAVRRIACRPAREAVDVTALEQALITRQGEPVIVVANAGTVNTVDFDDLRAIAALRERFAFWLHVDAAFGAFAALSAATAPLVDALDAADSICIDLHKWLNVPYDSAVQFTRRRDLQTRVFQNSAAYLGMPGDNPDFVHLTPENSRRLRALATWFALRAYGREGHREIVERNVAQARLLGERIAATPGLRLLAPVRLNVVCFTLADTPDEQRVQAFARLIRDGGEVFMTPTVHSGVWAMRAAFSNWRTTEKDTMRIAAALHAALNALP